MGPVPKKAQVRGLLGESKNRKRTHDEKDLPMTSSTRFPWPYWIMAGMLLLPCLLGSMSEQIGFDLPQVWAQPHNMMKGEHHQDHLSSSAPPADQWEGSPEGIAYSEFNHAFAGLCVLLVGLSELQTALGWQIMPWFRWWLPASLIGSGVFLLIWSDHEAWPIGSWTFVETLSGKDPEILQHKILGVFALAVGTVEWLLRTGKLEHRFWRALLPGFAVVGGFMLFIHMHGQHPAGHHIQDHHNVMGTLALAGGLAWFAGEFLHRPHASLSPSSRPRFLLKILWALLVVIIGIQLSLYSES